MSSIVFVLLIADHITPFIQCEVKSTECESVDHRLDRKDKPIGCLPIRFTLITSERMKESIVKSTIHTCHPTSIL